MDHQLFFSSISEASQVAEARRLTTQLAVRLGFNETEAGQVAIVVTEAGMNLVKHATGSQLLVRALTRGDSVGIEILALDQGPGITNLGKCLHDGYSTAGSLGTGLGAMMRLASVFDIYSLPNQGTALLAQLWTQDSQRAAKARNQEPEKLEFSSQSFASTHHLPFEIGVVCLPKPGQEVSGDNWGIVQQADRCLIMVADGLGHGPAAATAAQAALRILSEKPTLAPAAMIEMAHATLRRTRGAALAVVELNSAQVVKFAGIGNIAGTIFTPGPSHHLTSHNGIVGHQLPRVQEFVYPWSNEALLVLHSDGLVTRWNLDAYPGLTERHPSLIAGVLYRDFQRGHDDVIVLVVKQ